MDINEIIERLETHISNFDKHKELNYARKAAEAICKIILLGVGTNDAVNKAQETQLNTLIESLTANRLNVQKNHLNKIKDDLRRIQTYGNITSHDNAETLSSDEIKRINDALDNLLRNVFNSKDQIYIDQKLPSIIYQKITKSVTKDEDWRCDKIISIVYPNREKYITKQENDYSFYGLIDADSRKIGILFIGRNVCFKQIFETVLTPDNLKDISSLTFLLPIEMSIITGEPVKNRKEYIERTSREILAKIKFHATIKCSYEFIEDYIWERCLPAKAKKISTPPKQPYFIDQELYSDDLHLLSLDFVDSIVTNKLQEKKPIYLIFGDGGAGKTTFCDQAIQKINEYQKNKGLKKKAILLSSYDIPEHHLISGIKVESLQNLYSIISENDEDSIDIQSLALNVSSGNLLIIIDGLDEIQSKFKERFVLEKFIESVIELNDTYFNCSVVITSREINKILFERTEVDIFYLKGFDDALAQKYLSKRFSGDEKTIARAKENIAAIGANSNITPLIIRLICDLVGENSSNRNTEMTEKYLKKNNPLDKIVFQLIDREIGKQSLGISCDEYFEILSDIVFEHSGVVKKDDFDLIIELKLSNSVRINKQDNFNNFYLSPLLSRNGDIFRINYDSLEFLIKARHLTYLINETDRENNKNILKTFAQDCYKGGVLVKEICKYKRDDTSYESNLINNTLKDNNLDENAKRKLISALLYIAFENKHSNRGENSNIILDIFNVKNDGEIRGLSIYGEFYPLDFSVFTVIDGYFNDYSSLAKSNFPNGKKIFYSSQFLNINKKGFKKESIEKENFHDDCTICPELLSVIDLNNENNEKKLEFLKIDLKRIFSVGYRNSSFHWKSKKLYIHNCTSLKSNTTLENYLQILKNEGFLIEEDAEGSQEVGYKVCDKYMLDIKDFLSQSLITESIENLMKKILDK